MNPHHIINGCYIHYTCSNKSKREQYLIYKADEFQNGGYPIIAINISKNPLVDDMQVAVDFCINYNS